MPPHPGDPRSGNVAQPPSPRDATGPGPARSHAVIRERFLLRIARACRDRPRTTLVVSFLLAVVGVGAAWSGLEFRTSRNALVSADEPWHQRFLAYREEFGTEDEVIVALWGPPLEVRQRFADRLAEHLRSAPAIAEVFHRVDPAPFRDRALLYLDDAELEQLADDLRDNRDDLVALAEHPSLEEVLKLVDRRVSDALVGTLVGGLLGRDDDAESGDGAPVDLTFLLRLLEGLSNAVSGETFSYRSPWESWFGVEGVGSDGYLVSENEKYVFVLAKTTRSDSFDQAGPGLAAIRDAIAALQPEFPEVRSALTGQPVLGSEEVRTSTRDGAVSSIVGLIGVTLVFWIGFRRGRHAIAAVTALGLSLCWAAGTTVLLVGHLTILSVAFVSILAGLGDDFGIHLVGRYEEERAHGTPPPEALDRAVVGAGPGVFSGAIILALAFFALALTDFVGIAELGIIAGAGVLLCLVATFTALPALLALTKGAPIRELPLSDAMRPYFRRPGWWLATSALLCVASLLLAPGIDFDANLLDLQARGTEAVELERALIAESGRSSAFAVSMTSDLAMARALTERYERLPEVARVESLASVLPPDQEARIERVHALAPLVEDLPTSPHAPGPVDLRRIDRLLERLRFKVRPGGKWKEGEKPPEEELTWARTLLTRLHERLAPVVDDAASPRAAGVVAGLARYQARLADDLYDKLDLLKRAVRVERPVTLADLPPELRSRLVGRSGQILVRIFPREDVWEAEPAERFVSALRTVDPEVTGPTVQILESARLMLRGYLQGGAYALFVVVLLLLLDFRSLRAALLASLPLVVGGLWTLGTMRITGLSFNLANLVLLPLIIGIGIDTGIHLVHRHRAGVSMGIAVLRTGTGRAAIVSTLTSAVGFGSLVVSRHLGMRSIGILLGLGVLMSLVAALVTLAPLLEWLNLRPRRRSSPESAAPAPGSRPP